MALTPEELKKLKDKRLGGIQRQQGGVGGKNGVAGADASGVGAQTGFGDTMKKRLRTPLQNLLGSSPTVNVALGLDAPEEQPEAIGVESKKTLANFDPVPAIEPVKGLGETKAPPVGQFEVGAASLTEKDIGAQEFGPAVPLDTRLGELNAQLERVRAGREADRAAQILAVDGPQESRPDFEKVTVVGQGGPTGILDAAVERNQGFRDRKALDEIDSQQRRGRITPTAAAKQKKAVLGEILGRGKFESLERVAEGRQATDLAIGEYEADIDRATLAAARDRNLAEDQFKIADFNEDRRQFRVGQDLAERKLGVEQKKIRDKQLSELTQAVGEFKLPPEQAKRLVALVSENPALAKKLFDETEK